MRWWWSSPLICPQPSPTYTPHYHTHRPRCITFTGCYRLYEHVSIVRWLGTLFFCLWDQCVQHDGNAVHQRQQPNSSQRAWWLDGLQILGSLRKWVQQWFHYGNPFFGGSVLIYTPYCMNSMTGQSQWLVLGPHSKRILDSRTVCLEFACSRSVVWDSSCSPKTCLGIRLIEGWPPQNLYCISGRKLTTGFEILATFISIVIYAHSNPPTHHQIACLAPSAHIHTVKQASKTLAPFKRNITNCFTTKMLKRQNKRLPN